ncbi:hypothetical protein V8G54_001658 [Vigna mungo]|uniref:Uncharacterized protein n=1 Tax=Vigna mungo TaxID=3915 RepID=A0AAQ3P877_VIGMU
MDKRPEHGANASLLPSNGIGSRFSNLNKSFKYSIRSLLTSCSKEEFYKAFSSFSNTEREFLHRLFLQVITSLHENIEEGFETICLQTQLRIATIHYKTCTLVDMADGRGKVSFACPPQLPPRSVAGHTGIHLHYPNIYKLVCNFAFIFAAQAGATLDAVEEIVEEQDLDVLFSDRSNIMDVSENLSMAKKKEIQHLMHMVQLVVERFLFWLMRVSHLLFVYAHNQQFKNMNLNYGANSGDGIRDV